MDAPQLATLAEVAAWLGLPTFGSAVELNGAVVRKADYASTEMKEGDRMEIVRLVGGG
jgi:thiamine biosynthesis protein ThiS